MTNAVYFGIATLISFVLTFGVRAFAIHKDIVDRPSSAPDRKKHATAMPLLGGVAVFVALVITVCIVLLVQPTLLLGGYLLPKHLLGIALGGLIIMIGGTLDDIKSRGAWFQLAWVGVASLVLVAAGLGISALSNPLGNTLSLNQWHITVLTLNTFPYQIILPADLLAIVWILATTYATKLLDGLDGLVSGTTVIGMVVLFLLSIRPPVGQPETALLAIIGAGAFLGFWMHNFYPARIFIGEGGSMLAGFLLGALSIISGGKIATALLILGLPMLDVVWVILRRVVHERTSLATADRKHLHFRLIELGLSHRNAVLVLYLATAIFGSTTLFFSGTAKLVALCTLLGVMVLFSALTVLVGRSRASGKPS